MSYVDMYLTIESIDKNEERYREETSRERSLPLYDISYHQKLKTTNKTNIYREIKNETFKYEVFLFFEMVLIEMMVDCVYASLFVTLLIEYLK